MTMTNLDPNSLFPRTVSSSISPLAMVRSLYKYRRLILNLARRELEGRYRGSRLGVLWILLTPVLMLGVYTFAFGVVFKTRWAESATDSPWVYAIFLFAGLSLFSVFSEVVSRSPSLLLENVSYIKKLVFPIEILPVITLVASLFNFLISLALLIIMHTIVIGPPPVTTLLIPLPLLPLVLLSLGLAWFLSSLGVYLRDLRQIVSLGLTALLFLTPIFFPISALPERIRPLIELNPLTAVVETGRNLLFSGTLPNWSSWALSVLVSVTIAWLGFAWFTKTRKGFADVV